MPRRQIAATFIFALLAIASIGLGLITIHCWFFLLLTVGFLALPFLLRFHRRLLQNYAVVLVSSIVIIIVIDQTGLRWFYHNRVQQPPANIFDETPDELAQKREDRERTTIAAYHHFLQYTLIPRFDENANNYGFGGRDLADPKPEDETRVFCLGGSTTFGNFDEASYPFHLQKYMDQHGGGRNYSIQNAGVPAYTTLHSLINLAIRVMYHEPDYVLVYHGINDLLYHAPGVFKPDYSHTSYMSAMILKLVREGRLPILWHGMRLVPDDSPRFSHPTGLFYLSRVSFLGRTLSEHWRLNLPTSKAGSRIEYSALPDNYPLEVQPSDIGRSSEISDEAIWTYRTNLYNIVSLCRAHGVTPVLLTFTYGDPAIVKEGKRIEIYGRFLTQEAALKALEEQNKAIRELAEEEGVPLIDIRAKLPTGPDSFTDGVHFTKVFAEQFGNYVGASLLELEE